MGGLLRFSLVVAPVGQRRVGHAAPLFRLEIDHAVAARCGCPRRSSAPSTAAAVREQQKTHDIRYKPWN